MSNRRLSVLTALLVRRTLSTIFGQFRTVGCSREACIVGRLIVNGALLLVVVIAAIGLPINTDDITGLRDLDLPTARVASGQTLPPAAFCEPRPQVRVGSVL